MIKNLVEKYLKNKKLSVGELYTLILTEKKVSKQAVFKSVSKLVAAGKIKHDVKLRKYSLN